MDFYKSHKANLELLKALYPKQFSNRENIGLAWPDGWHQLVAGVCEWASVHSPAIRWVQIKEKFAGLRMYYADGPLVADNVATMTTITTIAGDFPDTAIVQPVIDAAVLRSAETCMGCGRSGSRKVRNGYFFTACEDCFKPDAE